MMAKQTLELWRGSRRERRGLVTLVVLAVGTLAIGIGTLLFRAPHSPAAWRGFQIATREGCFVCHGPNGGGGVVNPRSIEGTIPALTGDGTFTFYVRSPIEIREWIRYGRPLNRAASERFRQNGVIEMPAYEDRLDANDVEDLVAYVRTAAELEAPCDKEAQRGAQIAQRLACFGCHGVGGSGGFANPGSFKRSIPPWNGEDFDEVVKDDQELRQWILTGGIDRFRANPAARFFLDRQLIKMPAYADRLSEEELESLVKYVKWIRRVNGSQVCPKDWVEKPDDAVPAKPDLIAIGQTAYNARGCATCHGAEGRGGVRNVNHRIEKVPALDDFAARLGLYTAGEQRAALKWLNLGAPESGGLWGISSPGVFRETFAREVAIVISGAESQKRNMLGPKPPMDMPAFSHMHGAATTIDARADVRAIFAYLISLQDRRAIQ